MIVGVGGGDGVIEKREREFYVHFRVMEGVENQKGKDNNEKFKISFEEFPLI